MSADHAVARRVATGTVTNVIGQAVVVVTLVALAPVILHAVGATDYAIWVLIGSVASFAFLLELGISAGLVKFVAEHAARGEVDEAALMVGAAGWLFTVLGVLVALVGLLVALAVPAVIGLEGASHRLVPAVGALVAIDVGISLTAITPMAVLRGLQRFPAVNAIVAAGALLGAALTVAVLIAGGGIVGVAAVGALNSALTYAASVVVVRRTARDYMASPFRADVPRARRLLRFSRSIALLQVAARMQTRVDAIVIAAALPVRLVTPYSFAQRLADGTRIVTEQFGKVLLPVSTEVGTTRGHQALASVFLAATRLTIGLALAVGVPVALLGGPILTLWVGGAYSGYGALVALLACATIIELASYPAGAVLQSMERHEPIAWMALGSGVANIALSIVLVGPYGLEGVAAGTLIATAAEMALFVFPYAARVLGVSFRQFVPVVLLRLIVPAAVLAGAVVAGKAVLPVDSALRLLVVVGAAELAYAVVYAAIGATRYERTAYRAALAAALRAGAVVRGRRAEGAR